MSSPTDIVMTAARAVEYSDGTSAFAWVKPYAALPDEMPAFFLVRRSTPDVMRVRRGDTVSAQSTLQAVIYHPVDTLDLETETRTEHDDKVVRDLLSAFLYELIREDPTDPDTGQVASQPRAPTAEISGIEQGSRTVDGEQVYSLGFNLDVSGGAPDAEPLP